MEGLAGRGTGICMNLVLPVVGNHLAVALLSGRVHALRAEDCRFNLGISN